MSNLIPIEHQNQRVLTTQQLAEAYGTDDKKIRDNFTNNRHRYIPGKHYYKVEGEELQALKNGTENFGVVGDRASSVYLWTEKGAWLHAKSLNTDKAWEAYEMLVDSYYEIKEEVPMMNNLSPQLQLLINMELEQKRLTKRLDETEQTVTAIKDTIIQQPENWREELNKILNKIVITIGDKQFREMRSQSYKELETRAGVNLEARLRNLRTRMMEAGKGKTKINNACKLDVISEDKKLREIYSKIVQELYIKHVA